MSEQQSLKIIKNVFDGLLYLEKNHIIHRDLKAENVLSHNGVYKIADMGFSKQVVED